jgi:hypothetical protein
MNRALWTAALLVCVALPIGAQSPINFGILVARSDSFAVVVQGNVLGFHRMVIERTETGFRVVDDVQIGPVMTQRTEIELAADGTLRSTRQSGQVRGHDIRIDITYADGRARGSSTIPTVAGAHTITIDTTVAAGIIDDNLITALLPAFPWTPAAQFTVPVFLSGKGEIQAVTLAVKATESITVPAGTFDVYRVELAGGHAPVAMYVTTAPPHRLVKVAPQGTPLEFVLTK